ncbi:DUF4197 domain-containing protein [Mucilaginibacter koreensis]
MKKALLCLPLLLAFFTLSSFDTRHTTVTDDPTSSQIASALKQALEQGTNKSTSKLSALNGFFGDAAVKILFPPEAQKAERTLRKLGFNKLCDNLVLSLNRAAEDAAGKAAPIFVSSIKQMTLKDATSILTGGPDAATQYFRRTTNQELIAQFKPVIHASLSKVGAPKLYSTLATQYNKIPLTFTKLNPELDAYVTQKAIDGIFYQIVQEELNIRQNLSARTTPLLQQVFGFFSKKS